MTQSELAGYEVLVGVTGGIAAYKVAAVVSALVQRGAGVRVIMTRAARKFVGVQTFAALTGRRVHTSLWLTGESETPGHLRLGEGQDLFLIAPATADIIGKIAAGIADDLLTTTVIGTDSPVVLAPAMNARMWANPIVQRNLETLRKTGYGVIDPGEGWQACRTIGPGRMAEPDLILAALTQRLKSAPPRGRT